MKSLILLICAFHVTLSVEETTSSPVSQREPRKLGRVGLRVQLIVQGAASGTVGWKVVAICTPEEDAAVYRGRLPQPDDGQSTWQATGNDILKNAVQYILN